MPYRPRAFALGLGLGLLLTVAVAPAQAIEARRVVSDGGIEAWLVEDHAIPVIALNVGWRGGAALDPQGKAGLANMVSGLLDEGAGDIDSLAFRTELENKAIGLSFDATTDAFAGSLKTLTETRDRAFTLLRLAMTQPRFDAEPVERIRSQIITGLRFDQEDPQTIASRRWNAAVFGDHPYARPVEGTLDSVGGLTTDDLRGFVAATLVRDERMKIGVAGDITAEELKPLLDATFGPLPKHGAEATVPEATPVTGQTIVVDKDIPQAVAVFGETGLPRDDPDFYAAYVVNYILGGGGFASRLTEEVREKRGLAYSVYSYLYPLDHAALVIGGTATNNARMQESLALIRREWARMATDGPTAEELANAKTYLTGAYPLRFTSTDNIAAILMSMQLDHYPIDHLQTRNAKIEAVTLEQARRAAGRLLDPDTLTVVVVGRPDGVTPDAGGD
jgi:zinc protease